MRLRPQPANLLSPQRPGKGETVWRITQQTHNKYVEVERERARRAVIIYKFILIVHSIISLGK